MERKESVYKGYDNIFAKRLRYLMEVTKTTQQVLSENTNCTRQAIAQYVSGLNAPNVDKLVSIAEYFRVSTDYLLGLTYAETNDRNVQFVCDYTGLDEKAVEHLNDYKDGNHYSFINELICKQTLISQIDLYSSSLNHDLFFVDYFLNEEKPNFDLDDLHLPTLKDIDDYNQFEEEPLEKRRLSAALRTIDRSDFLYFRLIEDFKDCLNEFTSGKRKAIEEKRTEIQKAILDLEVKTNADNNEA